MSISRLIAPACASAGALLAISSGLNAMTAHAQNNPHIGLQVSSTFEVHAHSDTDRPYHSDIAFYETVLSHGPVTDPRLPFLLANAYIATSQQAVGITYFEDALGQFGETMSPPVQSTYLAAYALLRGTYASEVSLLNRIGWVQDTFRILEDADRISAGQNPLTHWAAGIIYTQVPGYFGKTDAAIRELSWLANRPETEPLPGFYREVYRHLAQLHTRRGEDDLAHSYQIRSGYGDDAPDLLFTGWFATNEVEGLRFSPAPWIETIIEDRIYAVRGFGFSDLHFIVSEDRSELFLIDAGTQPNGVEAAISFLRARYPELPQLSTVFITHAHWDHVGGQSYLRAAYQDLQFYGRGNYHQTVEHAQRNHVYRQFRGTGFSQQSLAEYEPDVTIDAVTEITVAGSTVELIPTEGGETEDALLIHFPALGTLFTGDGLMPFYGEPWVNEGDVDAALTLMDHVIARDPEYILHGHLGITVMYPDTPTLVAYRDAHAWLVNETRRLLHNAYSVEEIIRMNLIAPSLINHPEAFIGYLAPRDAVIRRLGDSITGIWREDSTGREPRDLDVINSVDRGRMLDRYFRLSSREVVNGLRRMIDGGDLELALETALAAETRYPSNAAITQMRREAADRLRSQSQFFDPFKFTVYTEIAGREHPGMPAPAHDQ
jgi:glyoxylase-like metal-dependent hydrolase (beta-lactamase superfamily II)